MVLDLGDALDHAHAQGIVHRDVKPANVLIREDGMTKLADLGIATASDGTQITRSGIVLGTAAVHGARSSSRAASSGRPADIYALAAIAFEALSGRKPREGRTPLEIAHQIANEGPPDLREAWPTRREAAAEVLKRGMALDPADRPESAGELARELAEALEGRADADRADPPLRARRRRARRSECGARRGERGTRRDTNGGPSTPTAAPAVRSSRAARTPSGHARADPRDRVHRARGGRDRRRGERRRRQRLLAEREPTPPAPEERSDTTNKNEPAKKKGEPKQNEVRAARRRPRRTPASTTRLAAPRSTARASR